MNPPSAFDDEVNMAEDEIKEINLVGFDVFYNFPLDGSEQVIITQQPEHGNLGDVTLMSESSESDVGEWTLLLRSNLASNTGLGEFSSGTEIGNPDDPQSNYRIGMTGAEMMGMELTELRITTASGYEEVFVGPFDTNAFDNTCTECNCRVQCVWGCFTRWMCEVAVSCEELRRGASASSPGARRRDCSTSRSADRGGSHGALHCAPLCAIRDAARP